MPFGDRTGPEGLGPRTGRGLGYCSGYSTPGYTKGVPRGAGYGWRRGFGMGFRRCFGTGFGRGWRFWQFVPYRDFGPTPDNKEAERRMLEEELRALESEKKMIEDRLKKLDNRENKEEQKQ